ncbi:MAG: oligosaccharide flippase family protein, partial [Desulfamplus sp.]|nr:oligosaccharide flippase family protein [Desulfamplus sp.]
MTSNFLSKAMLSIIGAFMGSGINLLLGVILARWLGPSDLGRYQMIVSFGVITASICSLGVGGATVYFIRTHKECIGVITTTAFKVSIGLGLAAFVLLLCFYSIQFYFGSLSMLTIFAAAINGFLFLFISANSQVLIAEQKVILYQWVQFMPRILLLLLLLVIWYFFSIDIEISIVSTSVGYCLSSFVLILFLHEHIDLSLSVDAKLLKNMISYGSLMSLSYVVILLNNESMNLIIAFFLERDFKEVGLFSRAFRTGVILLTFAAGIKPLLFSQLSGLNNEQRLLQMKRLQRVWAGSSLIPLIVVWSYADKIIVLLFSEVYLPSVPMFRVTLIGSFFYSFIMYHIDFYSASGKPVFASIIMGLNLFLLIVGGSILVPLYKGIGMCYTYVLATFFSLCFSSLICHNKFGMSIFNSFIITRDDVKYLSSKMM